MKAITHLARILVGVLFIFSGFVKVIDPLGFSYKLTEYFQVFGMPSLEAISIPLAILLCLAEIALGVQLLLGKLMKITAWGLLGMIVFFTFLTFYSAYFNKVTDCGCFGDAIPLNPWQSFYKDLILTVLIGWIFVFRKHISPILNHPIDTGIIGGVILIHAFFAYWGLAHLPIIDFRAYAEGKSIVEGMKSAEEKGLEPPLYATDFVIKNKETGEEKTVRSDQYSNQELWKTHDFVEAKGEPYKVKDGYEPPIHDFMIESADGEDMTSNVLQAPRIFLFISYDISKTNLEAHKKVKSMTSKLADAGEIYIGLSGSSFDQIENFRHEVQADYPYFNCDPTTLKTIVRSSPGLVVLEKGVVVAKFHHNDFPEVDEFLANRK